MKTVSGKLAAALLAASVLCYSPVGAARPAAGVPDKVRKAFADAGVPLSHVALLARPVGKTTNTLAWRAEVPMNPASTMKLLTTFAGLELLGPQYSWTTSVLRQGELADGVFKGTLVLRGGGDPKLTLEQFWLLLRELRLRGVKRIDGNIVLDKSLWQLPPEGEAFDATPLKPYNVAPDPLLANFKTLRFHLLPAGERIEILTDPPLPEVQLVNRLQPDPQPCGEWKNGLQVDVANSHVVTFSGKYRSSCGEHDYYLSLLTHTEYTAALLRQLWRELGGEFSGRISEGTAPAGAQPWFEHRSPPLAEVIRDINKYSNNTQARLLFLTLGLTATPVGQEPLAAAQQTIRQWLQQHRLPMPELVLENGSGLSRKERISAASLAALLDLAQASPLGAELESSLPLIAVDGTMKKRLAGAAGRAHVKTGSLDGVRAVAGYVQRDDGKWIVVGLVNHPQAANAVAALDQWIGWVAAGGAGD